MYLEKCIKINSYEQHLVLRNDQILVLQSPMNIFDIFNLRYSELF